MEASGIGAEDQWFSGSMIDCVAGVPIFLLLSFFPSEKVTVVADYEAGRGIPDPKVLCCIRCFWRASFVSSPRVLQILAKMSRVLGVKLKK